MLKPIRKSQLIEVTIPQSATTTRRFQIPDQPQLRDKFTQAIEFYSAKDVITGPSGNGNCTTTAFLSKCFLTLYVQESGAPGTATDAGAGEFIQNIPLSALHRMNLAGATASQDLPHIYFLEGFANKKIDFSKSYITSSADVSSGSATTEFIFNVHYTDQPLTSK